MFRRPAATPEQECHKAPAALGTQVAVYEDSIGQLILQWLRKPTYWSEGSSGTQALWHAYTPEPVTPSELALSRQACGVACDAQPVIKGTLPNRDIAHMAATSVLLQCLFDRFGSVFPQCGLMVFPGVVIVSR